MKDRIATDWKMSSTMLEEPVSDPAETTGKF